MLRSFQKTKLTQTSGSFLADRIEQVEKTHSKLKLLKIGDFLDNHGNYTSILVKFKRTSL